MPRVLSEDLRERVVAAVDGGMSCRQAAGRFGVGAANAIRWRQLVLTARQQPSRKVATGVRAGSMRMPISSWVAKDDITPVELQAMLAERGTPVGNGTLWRFFDRHRIRRKKDSARPRAGPPDVLRRREEWFDGQLDLDPERLVFIDETWASTNVARRHGRCRCGERLRSGVPHGHWKTTTLVAGLRRSGMIAPMVLDGPTTATPSSSMSPGAGARPLAR